MANNCKRFQHKVVLVTAATEGIGFGIAKRIGLEGAKVVICSRKQKNVEVAVEKLRSQRIEVSGTVCHVGKTEDLKKLVAFTVEKYGRIDVLVSNAAVNPAVSPILGLEEPVIDKLLDINIKSAILLMKEAVKFMKAGSNIVIISSYAAYSPSAPIALYGVTKTALIGLAKALAEELGPEGIRVNCVAPGVVPTKFAQALVEDDSAKDAQKSRTMLGRLGTVDDMAAAAAFLASDDASYITGETIVVAGGANSRL